MHPPKLLLIRGRAELDVVDGLTIAENIFLGHETTRAGLLDRRAMAREAAACLAQVGLAADPDTRVADLIVVALDPRVRVS